MSVDEVENYMVQLSMTKCSHRNVPVNVHDFHKRIMYSIPEEYEDEKKKEGPSELNGWWEYTKMQTSWFKPYLLLLRK